MKRIFIDADPNELIAWLRGVPVAAPPPPPARTNRTFICTMMSRDVVVIPPDIWPAAANVRSETLERK